MEYKERFGDTKITNINARVYENILGIPLSFQLNSQNSSGKSFFLGLGTYFDIVTKQYYKFKDSSLKPLNVKDSYGFGTYVKTGLLADIGVGLDLNENKFCDIGLKVNWDFKTTFINPDSNPNYNYYTASLYLKVYFTSINRK